MITFTVPGRPVPAQRMTRRTKWTDRAQRSLAYQQLVAWSARQAKVPEFVGEVVLTARFYVKGRRHGDLSNLVKSIEDGLQYAGVIRNDKQVVRYGEGTGIYYVSTAGEERAEISLQAVD
ncbi:MAG: RusA family crossover junction endodeoxyribonuclease [Moorellaceae bacterium]